MKIDINVKTFLRLDEATINLLLPSVKLGYVVKEHWMVWLIPTSAMPVDVQQWLDHQEPDSHDHCIHKDMNRLGTVDDKDRNYNTYVGIGVSLSQVSHDQIRDIQRGQGAFPLIPRDCVDGLKPTRNPRLYTDPNKPEFVYFKKQPVKEKPVVSKELPAEYHTFIDMLNGFDHWYSYSDSIAVYKNGEARRQELERKARDMGLTDAQVKLAFTESREARLKG